MGDPSNSTANTASLIAAIWRLAWKPQNRTSHNRRWHKPPGHVTRNNPGRRSTTGISPLSGSALEKPIVLADVDPDTSNATKKETRRKRNLSMYAIALGNYKARLYAENQHNLLIVLQAMDTGGKDGREIKYVFQASTPRLTESGHSKAQ